jgi:hypothetical protein
MINSEIIKGCEKEDIPAMANRLDAVGISQLVEWLNEKDDNFRYKSFLLLQARSQIKEDVYPYWDVFVAKLENSNSYQRSLGLMLIAENARWASEAKFQPVVERYLACCNDEKPVIVRQCIQGITKIVPYQTSSLGAITDKLLSIDLASRKDTQRKLLLTDILTVFAEIRKLRADERIERYFLSAINGGILDDKTKKIIAKLWQ